MKILLMVICLSITSISYCQTKYNNIYYECIINHIESKAFNETKHWGKIITDTLYIQQNDFVSEVPQKINGMNVKIIDNETIYKKTSRKKAITVIKINPIVFIEEGTMINIVTFGIARKKKQYTNINNGFTSYLIEYDCLEKKYKYKVKSAH